jgi:hypothetical protein
MKTSSPLRPSRWRSQQWRHRQAAQQATQDSVTGTIQTGNEHSDLRFTFNDVRSAPTGENLMGTVTIYTFVAGQLGTFRVSCLGVRRMTRMTYVVSRCSGQPAGDAGALGAKVVDTSLGRA